MICVVLLLFILSFACLIWMICSFIGQRKMIHLQLATAMLFTLIILLVDSFKDLTHDDTFVSTLLNYGYLTVFIWMNIVTVDMLRAVKQAGNINNPINSKRQQICLYCILGWGIPLVLTLIPVGLAYANVAEKFKTDFRSLKCWDEDKYVYGKGYRCAHSRTSVFMWLYLGVLPACSILFNIPIFIVTYLNMSKIVQSSLREAASKPPPFAPNLMFCFLMAVTWIFGIASKFTSQKFIFYIFAILCSLQGVFLFICFKCIKRRCFHDNEDRGTALHHLEKHRKVKDFARTIMLPSKATNSEPPM